MTEIGRQKAALSPSPRHMRKRRFRPDVPTGPASRTATMTAATSFEVHPAPQQPEQSARPAAVGPRPPKSPKQLRKASPRQKRLVALLIVILVSLSIPLLVLTLVFAG